MKAKIVISKNRVTSESIYKYCNRQNIDDCNIVYVQIDSDLTAISEYFGELGKQYELDQITGAIIVIENGDYSHIWVTWSNTPYLINTKYQHVKLVLY